MYQSQYKYYEKNKEELQKKARQAYHDKKLKDTFFNIRHYEEGINPFSNNNINGMGKPHRFATG